jgi:thiosulfate/3-mercaptopyruvate sulfurtransferase
MNALASTEWLAAALDRPDLVLFDATKYLPTDGLDGETEFRAGHIPGARYFDVDLVSDDAASLPHMVPTPARFEQLMARLGVSTDSLVVFYDQKGIYSAPRGWWMMGLFGHSRVVVLDGGLPKWRREGRPVESGTPPPLPAPGQYRADLRAARLRGIGDILANLDSAEELVIDARSAARFRAEAPEPRAGIRGGHIPGSINLPFTDLIREDQTMRGPDELRSRFKVAGADGSLPVVTSCGTGLTAAVLSLGLAVAGLPQGALYDGSWTEYGGRSDTPVES